MKDRERTYILILCQQLEQSFFCGHHHFPLLVLSHQTHQPAAQIWGRPAVELLPRPWHQPPSEEIFQVCRIAL